MLVFFENVTDIFFLDFLPWFTYFHTKPFHFDQFYFSVFKNVFSMIFSKIYTTC